MSETKTMHYELVNLTNIKCIWTGRQVRSPLITIIQTKQELGFRIFISIDQNIHKWICNDAYFRLFIRISANPNQSNF